MAATGNPSDGHENNFDNYKNHEKQDVICATGNGLPAPNNSLVGPSHVALHYNSGLSVKWSDDEQHVLEDLLSKSANSLSEFIIFIFCCLEWYVFTLYAHVQVSIKVLFFLIPCKFIELLGFLILLKKLRLFG